MYKQEEFELLDNAATWAEITRDKYFALCKFATRKDIDMTNLYIRELEDTTEWNGILRYEGTTQTPWLKFVKRPDGYNKYYANSEVMSV